MGKKIVIIGGGPIGCYTARLLKDYGNQPVVIEEHREIGRPVHCAGVVGNEIFTDLKIPISKGSIRNRIDGAVIRYGKKNFQIKRNGVAFVIEREIFDKELGLGLDVRYETKFLGFEKNNKGYLIETDKGEFQADILIGADGVASRVREAGGFKSEVNYKRGVQFRIKEGTASKRNFVEVYIKKPWFSWVIPEGRQTIRAGIISENPYHDLVNFLEEEGIKGEILEKFGGLVPIGRCQTLKNNIALVGDAASQNKPLTYGGIYYGMKCAEILARCIKDGRLQDYERRWHRRFGREMQIGLKVKEFYEQLGDRDLEDIFTLIKNNAGVIEKMANFETHSSIILEIMKDRNTQKKIGTVLWNLLKAKVLKA